MKGKQITSRKIKVRGEGKKEKTEAGFGKERNGRGSRAVKKMNKRGSEEVSCKAEDTRC